MAAKGNPRGIRTDIRHYTTNVSGITWLQRIFPVLGSGETIRVVKNLQVMCDTPNYMDDSESDSSSPAIVEHGFLRYPSSESISDTDIDVSSRYVLRAKISPWYNRDRDTPYTVITNYLKAINLTPDDQLVYFIRYANSKDVTGLKTIHMVIKDAGYVR